MSLWYEQIFLTSILDLFLSFLLVSKTNSCKDREDVILGHAEGIVVCILQ